MKRFLPLALVAVLLLSCSRDRMSFRIDDAGLLSMKAAGQVQIAPSPVGMACVGDTLYAPTGAEVSCDAVVLHFECGDVTLSRSVRPEGSLRLEVTGIDDGIKTFFFGPYVCPGTSEVGDIVGAAWHGDGSLVCIQSLNPKTVGQFSNADDMPAVNETGYPGPGRMAASMDGTDGILTCHADNFTRPRVIRSCAPGLRNVTTEAIPAPEGSIVGAAIILTRASSAQSMLGIISDIELSEGLPHPTLDGEWAKTSPHASDIYFSFGDGDMESQIRTVEKAGVKWIYFSDPFESWGHFDVSKDKYPGGEAEFKAAVDEALSHGINAGTHTLSNFIHTYDGYVTPVPHPGLLAWDPTPILEDMSSTSTEIRIGEALNYGRKMSLRVVRIGDELISFEDFDADRLCLTGCRRGAYGTAASGHPAGSVLTHLSDYAYGTLFPGHALQAEMAANIGRFMRTYGLRRMSFDGLEGCCYTGHGELGPNMFVKDVFDAAGGDLICDASATSHYRWHAMSYFNWGEPWYDSDRRGGNYNYRTGNVDYFHRNLLPGMLGWFKVCDSDRCFEPTLPETLDFIMSRTVAFQAGCLLSYSLEESPKADDYLESVRMWQDLRFNGAIPDEVRELMKPERTDWHLEESGDGWKLSEISIHDYDLRYTDRRETLVQMESGTSAYQPWGWGGSSHFTNCIIDRSSPSRDIPGVVEPAHLRVRVGTAEEKGQLHELALCGGWYGSDILVFDVTAEAGDYLEYRGGMVLYHYDRDYNLLETVEGIGRELVIDGNRSNGISLRYNLSNDDLTMTMKYIRTVRSFEIPRV